MLTSHARLRLFFTFGVVSLILISLAVDLRGDDARRPNVILIMTDDQGSGDLACLGNPVLKTPHLDALHRESVRLTNYHVDPTCSPTRAALLTGRYSSRTGVWHTIMGRSILHRDELTLGQLFANGGYATGCFGKWHLGETYPYRPQDRGFHEVVIHGGGGVGQTPDFWGNEYFDDTYWHNGHPVPQAGYCTDVFFDHALRFIETNRQQPFFVYLPTNAAHGPYLVDRRYSEPYKQMGIRSPQAEFFGMIANIDENVGRLRARLAEWGLAENTILIFTTDNGTAAGHMNGGFNGGLRAAKGSEYDGGHRVPCFWHWPDRFDRGRDVPELTAHVDMLPTLAALCSLQTPADRIIDGISLVPLLTTSDAPDWPRDRVVTVHSQRVEWPVPWKQSAVMTQRWRLVNGKELYDIRADLAQATNVADAHPELVERLRGEYESWWSSTSTRFAEYVPIVVGSEIQNPVELTAHDWHEGEGIIPWNQTMIARDDVGSGYWVIEPEIAGRYRFTLRRRPSGVAAPLQATRVWVSLGNRGLKRTLASELDRFQFEADLAEGEVRLQTWLTGVDGKVRGAYYVEIERVD